VSWKSTGVSALPATCSHPGFLRSLFYGPEDGGGMFLRTLAHDVICQKVAVSAWGTDPPVSVCGVARSPGGCVSIRYLLRERRCYCISQTGCSTGLPFFCATAESQSMLRSLPAEECLFWGTVYHSWDFNEGNNTQIYNWKSSHVKERSNHKADSIRIRNLLKEHSHKAVLDVITC
jgi:hypothetical protein